MPVEIRLTELAPECPSGSELDQQNLEPWSNLGVVVGGSASPEVRWYAQETINDRIPITRFGFLLMRVGQPTFPIWFGLATDEQVINYYDQPRLWEVYLKFEASDLPEGEVFQATGL